MLPVNDVAIEAQLRAEWNQAALHAPAQNAQQPSDIVGFFTALMRDRAAFERLAKMTIEGAELIATADNYFDEEARDVIRRLESLFREWSAKYAALEIPERHPLAIQLSSWIRPYNDALKSFLRALDDAADKMMRRLAFEEREDVDADAWADEHAALRGDEDTVSWDEVKAKLAGN